MKKKQTKTGPKSVTGFSILKIYLQEKQQKEDWILNRKRRNRAGFFLGILLLLFGSMPAAAARQESEPNQLFATAACLMDGDTGRVLFGKRETDPMAMASTTKIMTCILALENGQEQTVATASAKAAAAPKVHLGVREGEQFLLGDLLYSLMLESHNDSAVAVAEGIAGSVEEFAKEMNAKAAEIGCKDTHFITPNGLDAEDESGVHSTTAEDLAKIMQYCIMTSGEKEAFLEVTRTKEYQFQDTDRKRTFSCHNHNAFLDMMDGALSGKTGFTAEAGYCYVGSLRRDERTFIVALLACGWPDNKGYKWKDTRKLMEYGLEHYQYRDIDKKMQIPEIKVAGGVDDKKPYQYCLNVPVKIERPAEENSKILMRDGEELRAKMELAKYWNAPLKKGEKIGMLTYYLDGYKVAEYELKNEKAVAKRDFSWCIFWIIKSVML